MNSYRLSKRAENDLYEILLYGYETFGPMQGEACADELEYVFKLLAGNPHMGRPADAIADGVRRHEHAAHVILYEESRSGITILALVHERSIGKLSL